ncbi:MAG: efflux RND transporter permease subunit [Bacteroidales bacterium]|nr:efflux RND transporter permease subunit [Bacteroidales bacterium]
MKQRGSRVSAFSVVIAALCLSLIGLSFIPLLPLKLSPSQTLPSITVSFSMRGATSKVVESEATSRFEAMLSRMSGVQKITSTSDNGKGSITINFDKHVDMDAARFEVSNIVRQTWHELPSEVSYPSVYARSSDRKANGPFLVYSINSSGDLADILHKSEEVFKNGFADIEGISSVDITGAQNKEWRMTYDVEEASRLGLTDSDIASSVLSSQYKTNLGKHVVRTEGVDTCIDLRSLYIPLKDSTMITADRVAKVEHVEARPGSIFRVNGLNSIYLSLKADDMSNQIAVGAEAEKRVAELKAKLPQGYEVHKLHDSTEYIKAELDKIYFRSGLTVLILLVFVFLTSFSWRQVVVVVTSIVCNLAVSAAIYYALGVELQLYSLAGITIALNLIIDNTIVMADHWRRRRDLTAILPILAATLTTIAALSIVFFLDDRLRINLYDFSVVMIVNLALSVVISLTLVPAVMEVLKVRGGRAVARWRLRLTARFNRSYIRFIRFSVRRRWLFVCLGVWAFGLPLYMMPQEIKGEGWGAQVYNAIFGSETYKAVRQYTDVIFGGALRLFADKVYSGSYFTSNEQTVLYIAASLPYGSTIEQMDENVRKMEAYLTQFDGVRQFQSDISAQRADISVYFTKEAEGSGFPYRLKSDIISKALQIGGGSWSVYGLQDQGFSNNVTERAGTCCIEMRGYNYEQLYQWADSVRNHLLSYRRIKEVDIKSRFSYYKDDYMEYQLVPNKQEMARQQITATQLFNAVSHSLVSDRSCGVLYLDDKVEQIVLRSLQSETYDIWALLNRPVELGGRQFKVGQLCSFEKTQAPSSIVRENQQYYLCLQYEYIGSGLMADRVSNRADSIYSALVPVGYDIQYKAASYSWGKEDSSQYWLLALVLAIIFVITSILFDSLRMPMVIIGIVPISYVGMFLTFYVFSLNFDQGGFASLVLLCGVTVNSSIYIVNEYQRQMKRRRGTLRSYIKAFGIKLTPILMTVLSTILGFIPFLVGSSHEAFWFPLAAGTIGGLLFSILGLLLFLPAFCISRRLLFRQRK